MVIQLFDEQLESLAPVEAEALAVHPSSPVPLQWHESCRLDPSCTHVGSVNTNSCCCGKAIRVEPKARGRRNNQLDNFILIPSLGERLGALSRIKHDFYIVSSIRL